MPNFKGDPPSMARVRDCECTESLGEWQQSLRGRATRRLTEGVTYEHGSARIASVAPFWSQEAWRTKPPRIVRVDASPSRSSSLRRHCLLSRWPSDSVR